MNGNIYMKGDIYMNGDINMNGDIYIYYLFIIYLLICQTHIKKNITNYNVQYTERTTLGTEDTQRRKTPITCSLFCETIIQILTMYSQDNSMNLVIMIVRIEYEIM